LLFLAARRVEYVDETERRTVRGLAWGIVTSFVIISLLPGSLSRYTMPLLAPACWLLAMLLCAERLDLPRWLKWTRPVRLSPPLRLPLCVAVIVAIAICGYAVGIVPFLQKRQKVKTIAQRIDAAVGNTNTVYAVDPDYQPFLFYVRAPLVYVSGVEDLRSDAKFVLVQPQKAKAVEASRPARVVLHIKDYRERETILYRLE
jgi:4-amino-4-deoxy-L-arabinose transferase-like glycosyltransferase